MRTQTLLLAALGVASAATAMAQVYSVNAVGYVNTVLEPGWNLISNPLDNKAGNKISELLNVGKAMTVFKFVDGKYVDAVTYDTDFEEWSDVNATLEPGEGAFVQVLEAVTVTFVGEVVQGQTVNQMDAGWNIVSSKVPQTGKLVADLKFPAGNAANDSWTVYTYAGNAYTNYSWDSDFEDFGPTGDPTINVGQAFWAQFSVAKEWARTFDVNNPN